jgi:hypothetical protein
MVYLTVLLVPQSFSKAMKIRKIGLSAEILQVFYLYDHNVLLEFWKF